MRSIKKVENWLGILALAALCLYLVSFFKLKDTHSLVYNIRLSLVAEWILALLGSNYFAFLRKYTAEGYLLSFNAMNYRLKKFTGKTVESPEVQHEIRYGVVLAATLTFLFLITAGAAVYRYIIQ